MVARVYGIPVRIDYRWFIVFALSVLLIASNLHKSAMQLGTFLLPPTNILTAWTLGIVTTLALFLSVFGHELSHALVGRAEGIEIEEIVLHPFGGLARLRTQPQNPRAEFRIAVAGPAASFLISLVGFACAKLAAMAEFNAAVAVFFFVGAGNLLLAIFNLFPGYPLDGGRVLRALLWRRSGNMLDATRVAGFCGQLMALALIAFGLYMALAPTFRAYFMGLWSILVGVFLLTTASNVVKSARGMKHATVADAMSAPSAIEPDLPISRFIDEVLPMHRQATFPVARQRLFLGILMLEDLKSLPREKWREVRARDAMRPANASFLAKPSMTMAAADHLMQCNGAGALAVVNDVGELVGFLRRHQPKRRK